MEFALSTEQQMLLHVDMTVPRIAPIAPEVYQALQAILAAHQDLPKPAQAGRRIGIARKA